MPKTLYRPMIDLIKSAGYELLRHSGGSHEIWKRDDLTIMIDRNVVDRHLANSVLRRAGITKKL